MSYHFAFGSASVRNVGISDLTLRAWCVTLLLIKAWRLWCYYNCLLNILYSCFPLIHNVASTYSNMGCCCHQWVTALHHNAICLVITYALHSQFSLLLVPFMLVFYDILNSPIFCFPSVARIAIPVLRKSSKNHNRYVLSNSYICQAAF